MHTYLIGLDNSILLTEATEGIVEKTNLTSKMRFVTPRYYNDYDMAEFDAILEYITPISKNNSMIQLTLTDDSYKDDYCLFELPTGELTTALTAEVGEVQFSITFINAAITEDGTVLEHVRSTSNYGVINVLPVSTWFSASQSMLTEIASMYLENKKLALALTALANQLNEEKADDITLDLENEKVVLTANGNKIGNGVTLESLNQELVLVGGQNANSGNVSIQKI